MTCCYCGKGLSTLGWNASWFTFPDGARAHPGCLEDVAWDAYKEGLDRTWDS